MGADLNDLPHDLWRGAPGIGPMLGRLIYEDRGARILPTVEEEDAKRIDLIPLKGLADPVPANINAAFVRNRHRAL